MSQDYAAPAPPLDVSFFYIKSQQFRVLHVDGVIGGPTPGGLLHIAVYSERPAIPQLVEHQLNPDGELSPPLKQSGKNGIVRELDADLILSLGVAKNLRDWLTERIRSLEDAKEQNSILVTGASDG